MSVGSVVETIVQYLNISFCYFGFLGEFLAQHFFSSSKVTVEQPANQSECKHIFATENRFVIQSGVFQALFAHGRDRNFQYLLFYS